MLPFAASATTMQADRESFVKRVRFTSGEALVVRVVACANVVVLLMAAALVVTLVVRAGDEYATVKAAQAIRLADDADAACRRAAPASAAGYRKLWDSLDHKRWASAEAVAHIPLKGRSVWLYGATTTTRNGEIALTAWSSAITQRGGCLHVSHFGDQVFSNDPTGAVYSMIAGIATGPNSILVTVKKLTPTGDCADCTIDEGRRAAELAVDSKGDLSFTRWIDLPDDGVQWGAAMTTDGKTVAIFGTQRDMSLVGYQVKVATVALGNFADRSRWKVSRGVIADGVKDPLTAWQDSSGWHLATVPQVTSVHDDTSIWRSPTAGGTYRLAELSTTDLGPDRRFNVGGGVVPSATALAAGR